MALFVGFRREKGSEHVEDPLKLYVCSPMANRSHAFIVFISVNSNKNIW